MAERPVQFFHFVDADGVPFPNQLATDRILQHVEDLGDDEAYWHSKSAKMELLGDVYWTSDKGKVPMLILNRITREARLRIERARSFSDFRLGDGETLADPCYVGFFERNVVGLMRAGAAPGSARLEEYINKVVKMPEVIKIDPLVLPDTVQQLTQESEILTSFEFRIPGFMGEKERAETTPYVRRVLEDTLAEVGHVKNMTVTIKLDPRSDVQAESDRLLNAATGLMQGPTGDLVEVAKVKYRRRDDGGADEVDLLKQRVAMEVAVDVDAGTDRASEATASMGLATAYSELLPKITRALDALSP